MSLYSFFEEDLKNCPTFNNREEMWDAVLIPRFQSIHKIVEFGVWRGKSLRWFSEKFPNATVFGFDSFKGLPEDWNIGKTIMTKGTFNSIDADEIIDALSKIPNVNLIEGLFEDTLPVFCEEQELLQLDLVHFDCDLYSSTKTALQYMEGYFKTGTLLLFDEFTSTKKESFLLREHEYRAFAEFCKSKETFRYKFLGKTLPVVDKVGEQVIVEIINV